VTTDLGHIIVFGLDRYVSGIRDPYRLRSVVEDAGGVMIAAHPFRNYLFDPSTRTARSASVPLERLATWPIFGLVDEVEVLKSMTSESMLAQSFQTLQTTQYSSLRKTHCCWTS
jgi:hypothetical protein